MHPGPDHLGAPPSFTARRPNASNLPNHFELPPPQLSSLQQKYPFATINATQPSPAPGSVTSVGNLLTPPNTLPGDGLSPVSSGVASNPPGSAHGVPPYTPNGYVWSNQGTPYGFQSGQQSYAQSRGLFSPSLNSLIRNNPNSPTATEGLPPPPYEINLPSFPSSGAVSAPSTLPAMSAPQHAMSSGMMGAPTPVSSSHGPQPSPVHAQDSFQAPRPPPTPTYYPHSAHSQQSPFPYSAGPSPTQQSPGSAGGPIPRTSQAHSAGPIPHVQSATSHSPHTFQRPFGPYPGMPGPVLSNVNNPNGQLALVGGMPHGMVPGFNSGHAASMQHMYGGHHPAAPPPTTDRPFKCDQCPQSFNRNHDLKRHKRIHLAVKPFPCGHCDKSFSRKDALKRHILVKGCGKAQGAAETGKQEGSQSPTDRASTTSDAVDMKPAIANHS